MKGFMQKVVIAVFIILCIGAVAFAAISGIAVYLEKTDASTPDQRFFTQEAARYRIDIDYINTWKKDIEFKQFEPLADDREFYLNGPETNDPDITLNKYYLDSTQGFYKLSEINDSKYHKELDCLFGTDESNINFILNIKYADEEYEQWYIKKGYHIPSVEKDNVSKLILIDDYHLNNDQYTEIKSHPEFKFVNVSRSGKEITDRAVIQECLKRYRQKEYDFTEKKNDFDYGSQTGPYFVLAAFENDSLYQCIGYFYN